MEMILPYQPEGYRRLLKYSFVLYNISFRRVLPLSILVSLMVFTPRLIATLTGQDFFFQVSPLSPYRLWIVLLNLIGLTFFVAMLWRMHCITRDIHEPLIEDFAVGLRKAFYVFVATLIQSVIVFLVTIIIYSFEILLHRYNLLFSEHLLGIIFTLIVFLGEAFLLLYVTTLFIFLTPIIAIEHKGILSAIKRSVSLVWNHWLRVITVQLTPWICYLIVLLLIRYVFKIDVHIYFLEHGPHGIFTTILQLLLFILFIPWVASLLIVQLRDLEIRKHITQQDKNAV